MGEGIPKREEKGEDKDLITFNELRGQLSEQRLSYFFSEEEGEIENLSREVTKELITLRTTLKKGTVFNTHYHDCEERIIVYSGRLLNVTKNQILTRGKLFTFERKEVHKLKALEDTVCYVEFENPHK